MWHLWSTARQPAFSEQSTNELRHIFACCGANVARNSRYVSRQLHVSIRYLTPLAHKIGELHIIPIHRDTPRLARIADPSSKAEPGSVGWIFGYKELRFGLQEATHPQMRQRSEEICFAFYERSSGICLDSLLTSPLTTANRV